MNRWINEFPSKQFYEGKLTPDKSNVNWKLSIDNHFRKHQEVLDIDKPEVLFCHDHKSEQSRSDFEAGIIAEFVKEYIAKGLSGKDIAIITPFRAQVRQIKKHISRLESYIKIKEDLFIDTVERIQGQEREVIIFSLATSNPERAKQRAEFFFNPNRFNVALTRAKKKRIVLANRALFQMETADKTLIPLIKNFKDFFNTSTVVMEEVSNEDLF